MTYVTACMVYGVHITLYRHPCRDVDLGRCQQRCLVVTTVAHKQWITHRCNIFVHQIFHGGRDFLESFGHRLVVRDNCTTAVCVRIGSISTNEQRVLRGTGFEKLDLQ